MVFFMASRTHQARTRCITNANVVEWKGVKMFLHNIWMAPKVIRQRHQVRIVPVTKVTYEWKGKLHVFYVYGYENKIHLPKYPQKCCWGCQILQSIQNDGLESVQDCLISLSMKCIIQLVRVICFELMHLDVVGTKINDRFLGRVDILLFWYPSLQSNLNKKVSNQSH